MLYKLIKRFIQITIFEIRIDLSQKFNETILYYHVSKLVIGYLQSQKL